MFCTKAAKIPGESTEPPVRFGDLLSNYMTEMRHKTSVRPSKSSHEPTLAKVAATAMEPEANRS
jgi:hypothetical protein